MTVKTTILSVSVHHDTENAIFGEGITHVSIEDEAAGGFIRLCQVDSADTGSIILDIEELDAIHEAAHMMLKQYES